MDPVFLFYLQEAALRESITTVNDDICPGHVATSIASKEYIGLEKRSAHASLFDVSKAMLNIHS